MAPLARRALATPKPWFILWAGIAALIAGLLYHENLYLWWLVLLDWLGTLRGQPWPGTTDDMFALAYLVRSEQLMAFVGDLIVGAVLAIPTMGVFVVLAYRLSGQSRRA